jgi:integrase
MTERTLYSLKAKTEQQAFWDENLPRFGVRVSLAGRKTFCIRYRVNGKRRRMSLGRFPYIKLGEARDHAKELFGQIARGIDPQDEPDEGITFGELAEQYLELHAKRKKRSWREDERMIRRELMPEWGSLLSKDIQRRDLIGILDRIMDRGAPTTANRTRALVSKMFNFGIERQLVSHNPVFGVSKPAPERRRDRFLSEDEIRTLWNHLAAEGSVMARTFMVRLLTAQRGVEVMSMRWEDLDDSWWTIPAGVVKNKMQHHVPLSRQTRQVIDSLRPLNGRAEWVFASPKKSDRPITWPVWTCRRLCDRIGFRFVPHDLRRTAATHMARMGVQRIVLAKILNHADNGVTAIYDRSTYDREKQEALTMWGDRVEMIVRSRPSAQTG